jgi:uncharacterized protein YecE (DUF72 family)
VTRSVRLFAGTSGYSYKEWKGSFYPEKLPAKEMLRFYAQHFGTVEINNTFYRMPQRAVLASWLMDVPETFTFVLKAPQRITHIKRLKDAGDDVAYFFDTASELGGRLGPILFQLPPFSQKDVERLRSFLAALPKDRKIALEFRHASWLDEEIFGVLRAANVALCLADVEEEKDPPPMVTTADFGYLRLRRCDYTPAGLEAWIDRIRSQPWNEAFVFFKHEDEATGPKLAQEFIRAYGARDLAAQQS